LIFNGFWKSKTG